MSLATTNQAPTSASILGPEGLPLRRISGAEYDHMVEAGVFDNGPMCYLWNGMICEAMSENPPHDFAVGALMDALFDRLDHATWVLRASNTIALDGNKRPMPDLAVAQGPRRRYQDRYPVPAEIGLLVEVANTSYPKDWGKMLKGYAAAGISLYWIINIPSRRVEVYRNPRVEGGVGVYDNLELYPVGAAVPLELDGRAYPPIPVADLISDTPAVP